MGWALRLQKRWLKVHSGQQEWSQFSGVVALTAETVIGS